jgi:hypothetical protein
LLSSGAAQAGLVVRQAHGANGAAIQGAVDQFRVDLGGSNNGVGGSFPGGRREINWDGVPDASASPNFLAPDFFNVNSPRGVILQSPCGAPRVSADSSNPTATPTRFGELDPSYSANFVAYTAERLFTVYSAAAASCEIVELTFFVPGTTVPATVSGFGAVFTDVDLVGGTRLYLYAADGTLLGSNPIFATPQDGGLSFVGVSFDAGERIARVSIAAGPTRLANGNTDEVSGRDVVAMDDFIYGEPRPMIDCIYHDAFECAVPPAP